MAEPRRTRRARRGRPAQPAPPPREAGERLGVAVAGRPHLAEDKGWTVLATTISAATGPDAEMLQASQEQQTTGAPGLRWSKQPAALNPVWREKPERMAALARLTVVGWLVYSLSQRQGRLALQTPAQPLPGNTGLTATPTAAVLVALCAPVALLQ